MSTVPQMYYVYILCRPDKKYPQGKPFYVGKGSGRRVHDHEMEARSGHHCHKCNVIRKVWKSGGEIQRYIVFTTEDEQEALAYEIELIADYGRNLLVNKTDGGDEPPHEPLTPEQRAANGAKHKAKWADPSFREKVIISQREAMAAHPERRAEIGRATRAKWADPEHRSQRVAAIRASRTPEVQARRSATLRAYYADPANRQKVSEQLRHTLDTPEAREKLSKATKAGWDDPVIRAKRIAGQRARVDAPGYSEEQSARSREFGARPEYKAKRSAINKARFSDPAERARVAASVRATSATPESKAKRSAASKAMWADPEYRARQSARLKAHWERQRAKKDEE